MKTFLKQVNLVRVCLFTKIKLTKLFILTQSQGITQSGNLRAAIVYVIARLFRQCQTPQSAQKFLLPKSVVHYMCHLKSNNIIGLLVVIHHENIDELTSLRFLNLNLEQQNIKMRRKTYEGLFFFLFISRDHDLNHQHAIGYHSCFIAATFFNSCSYYNSYTWSKNIALIVKKSYTLW